MPPSEPAKPAIAGRDRFSLATFFLLAAIVLAGDLALKSWAFNHVAGQPVPITAQNAQNPDLIPDHPPVELIPHVLSLKLTLNRGAVFGVAAGQRVLFVIVTFVAIAVVIVMFWRSDRQQRALHIGLSLVLAGALGNLYDRIAFGAVRDMLYLFPGVPLPFGWHWPDGNGELYPWIFNVADAALCVGVALILLLMLRKPDPKPSSEFSK